MKKMLLFSTALTLSCIANAQVGTDTLLWNDFETDPAGYMQIVVPPGNTSDTSWYTFDFDGNADGSGSGRPGEWFWALPFSDNDTLPNNFGVMASNSWSNSSTPNDNILVTPSVYIGDTNAVLHWKSCPYQTPRYLDGYDVVVAVGNNDPGSFTDTIFKASEYISLDNSSFPNDFSSYTFAPTPTSDPMNPFVHGKDGTYTELDPTSDSSRLVGRLRPFQLSLSQYAGQTIFIMFLHNCTDDNLISVDEVLVTGTNFTGIHENTNAVSFVAYPNPATDFTTIRYTLPAASDVTVNVYDVTGKLISSEEKGKLPAGEQQAKIDVNGLTAGMYRVELVTSFGRSNNPLIVR